MATEPRRKPAARKPAPRKTPSRAEKPRDRTLGVTLLSAGAAAVGLGAAIAALLIRRRDAKPAGHPAPDLAPDAPAPDAADEDARAPEHFRPDPTAVPSADEREALRPATGPATAFAADRGSVVADPQDAA